MKKGFNNEKYVEIQSKKIKEKIKKFDKLYLEFGGKLFDDYHASRVLPGFEPDSKIKMLLELKDITEIIMCINAKDIERKMKAMYGDVFQVEYDRDVADYVYLSERLISLSGKKYHGKRNHINRFKENHEWTYEPITDDNALECIVMLMQWKINNCAAANEGMSEEVCAAKNALMYYKELGLTGGLIRSEGVIIAFSLGEPISDDMFAVHFEKAFSNIQGAYPIINQQFVLHEASEYKYINREEDCGDEGLRKAKMSYRPEMMVEKGVLKFREKE